MSLKKPIKRLVSGKALEHLEECLNKESTKPGFDYQIEVFYFFLDIFYRLKTYNKYLWTKETDSTYIAVSSNYFKAKIDADNYRNYISYLKGIGILLVDERYYKNEAKGYKYNPIYESELVAVLITPEMPFWKKLVTHINIKRKHKAKPEYLKALEKRLRDVKVDIDGATAYLSKMVELGFIDQNLLNCRVHSLKRVNDGDFFFGKNKTNGRLDHNLTNMKRELRNYMVGNYIQIDLKNSHPYLFNYIINQYITSHTISYCGKEISNKPLCPFIYRLFKGFKKRPILKTKEVKKYHDWTREGKIYDLFTEELEIGRDEAKMLFLAAMYASNTSTLYKYEIKLFNKLFPTVGRLVKELKRKDYSALPIAMQCLESEIFIDTISQKLVSAGIIPITVHDAIIVREQELTQAQAIIDEVFMTYFNEVPTFDIKKLYPESDEIKNSLLTKPREKITKKPKRKIRTEEDAQNSLLDYAKYLVEQEMANSVYPPDEFTEAERKIYHELLQLWYTEENNIMQPVAIENLIAQNKPIITPYEEKNAALQNLCDFARETKDWYTFKILSQSLKNRKSADKKYKISQRQRKKIESLNEPDLCPF